MKILEETLFFDAEANKFQAFIFYFHSNPMRRPVRFSDEFSPARIRNAIMRCAHGRTPRDRSFFDRAFDEIMSSLREMSSVEDKRTYLEFVFEHVISDSRLYLADTSVHRSR